MAMRTGTDSFGRSISPSDHLHFVYRLVDGEPQGEPLVVISGDRALTTRDTDLWEIQERILQDAFEHGVEQAEQP